MTPFELHVLDWKDCDKCELAATRYRICLVRGTLPCDILFVGEAPGESENVLGRPFVGPAGRMLDSIVEQSVADENYRRAMEQDGKGNHDPYPPLRVAFTNLVACIPRENKSSKKATEPDAKHIKACAPRLVDIASIADPKLVVCVGSLAEKWLGSESAGSKNRVALRKEVPTVHIVHPAAILRAQFAQRGLMIQKAVVTLTEALEDI